MAMTSSCRESRTGRRVYSDELKAEAVQMLLDGRSAESVVSNLGLSGANALMVSCFGTVKTELEMEPYENEHIARKEAPDSVRSYNTRRRHLPLGYLGPEAFEALTR